MDSVNAAESLGYVAAVIPRCRRGKLKVLVMRTVKIAGARAGLELWQLPGGMEELVDQGNPFRALNEELCEETGFHLRPNYKDPELITTVVMPDGHTQRYYLVWREGLRGELRTKPVNDGGYKRLEPPEWKSVDFLKRNLCDSHQAVLPYLRNLDLKIKGLK